jgi:hypothetical protein
MIVKNGTLDVTHYQPPEDTVKQATKIDVPEDSPMQFQCYLCHKPHDEVRPDWGNCFNCHRNVIEVGKHEMHVQMMSMKCNQCHKPHSWTVTEESAKKDCVMCHEYKSPKQFLGG